MVRREARSIIDDIGPQLMKKIKLFLNKKKSLTGEMLNEYSSHIEYYSIIPAWSIRHDKNDTL